MHRKAWMALIARVVAAAAGLLSGGAQAAGEGKARMVITHAGDTSSAKGLNPTNFTGAVHVDLLHAAQDAWRASAAYVTFERGLVTVASLVANGQMAQLTPHLNRAMDNGLTQADAGEMFTQLAFHAGWPNVFSAIPVAKAVFESRAK